MSFKLSLCIKISKSKIESRNWSFWFKGNLRPVLLLSNFHNFYRSISQDLRSPNQNVSNMKISNFHRDEFVSELSSLVTLILLMALFTIKVFEDQAKTNEADLINKPNNDFNTIPKSINSKNLCVDLTKSHEYIYTSISLHRFYEI